MNSIVSISSHVTQRVWGLCQFSWSCVNWRGSRTTCVARVRYNTKLHVVVY